MVKSIATVNQTCCFTRSIEVEKAILLKKKHDKEIKKELEKKSHDETDDETSEWIEKQAVEKANCYRKLDDDRTRFYRERAEDLAETLTILDIEEETVIENIILEKIRKEEEEALLEEEGDKEESSSGIYDSI